MGKENLLTWKLKICMKEKEIKLWDAEHLQVAIGVTIQLVEELQISQHIPRFIRVVQ